MANLVTESRAQQNPQLVDADGTVLGALIAAASAAVEQYCGRVFTSEEREETYDGTGTREITLRVFPVTEVSEIIELDDDDVETEITSGYRLNARTGLLRLKEEYFPAGLQNIVITYTAGFTTIPADVQEATVQIVAKMHADGLHDPVVAGEKLGDYQYQRAVWSSEGLGGTIKALLAPYRDRDV